MRRATPLPRKRIDDGRREPDEPDHHHNSFSIGSMPQAQPPKPVSYHLWRNDIGAGGGAAASLRRMAPLLGDCPIAGFIFRKSIFQKLEELP